MDDIIFQKILDFRFQACKAVLSTKSREYARSDDRLHNFKRAGAMLGVSPEQALLGMWSKHIISILDIVTDIVEYGNLPSDKIIEEKFTDSINYLTLLEALIIERRGH